MIISLPLIAAAQASPEFMLTWHAASYVPPAYSGKALPIVNTKITVAVSLISAGKFVDLSRHEIRWVINDRAVQTGLGKQEVSFAAEPLRALQKVRVTIQNYNGGNISHFLKIPTVKPEIIINRRAVNTNPLLERQLEATPFFFNIPDPSYLTLVWSLGGKTASGPFASAKLLEVGTAGIKPGTLTNIKLTASSLINSREQATKLIFLKI